MSASPQVQVIWGQLEDRLREWGERNPHVPHRRYELAVRQAIGLCGRMADTLEHELAQYREHKTWESEMELTEFLTARLDEDAATARDAYYDGQVWVPEEEAVVAADRDLDPVLFLDRKRDAQHAANWSPARVLAQVTAMRAVLDAWPDKFGQWNADQAEAARAVKDMIRRKFAAIWSDHPVYDPAWSPEEE